MNYKGSLHYAIIMNNNENNTASNNHKDTELQHSSIDNEMNVAFVEQEPLVQDDARLGHSLAKLPPSLEAQMPDEHWMAAKQLSKPVVISHFNWSSTSATGVILEAFNFPQVISRIDSIHTETLNMYSFFKFNWNLKFQLNGTKFHSGQLMASFDPFYQAFDAPATGRERNFDAVYATGLPNVKLNASSNQPVEMVIPYVHPRNFMTTNSTGLDLLGRVRISVLNQLRYAQGSSENLSITVYLYATDPSVHVPIYRHVYNPNSNVIQAEQSMDILGGLGIGSKLKDVAGNLATGNFGGALKSASPMISGVAKLLGLDYPARIIHPQSHINSLGPMAHGKGVDQSYRLALVPESGHVAEPEQTGTTQEECSIDYIKKIPMLFRQVVWADTATTGSILTYFPVHPNIACNASTDTRQVSNNFLSYLSNLFSYWQGSLNYNIELVSTQFHTGRLLCAFIPNQFNGTPTLTQAYSCPYAVIDLQETSNVQLTVPFVSPLLMKSTDLYSGNASDENVVGYMYIYVLNPLVRPSNVDGSVEFNIYISAGSDFVFTVPRSNLMLHIDNGAPQPTLSSASLLYDVIDAEQSMALDRMATRTSTVNEPETISVAFGTPISPPKDYFGETFSLVDYMKRYSLTDRSTIRAFSAAGVRTLPVRPYGGGSALSAGQQYFPRNSLGAPNNPLSSVQQLFACWTGSIRYKLATNANRSSDLWLSVTHIPLGVAPAGYQSGGGFALQRTNLSQNNALEVEFPYYAPYNFLLSSLGQINEATNIFPISSGFYIVDSNAPDGDATELFVYEAAGDDFRPFYLIPPPQDFTSPTDQLHWVAPLRIQ